MKRRQVLFRALVRGDMAKGVDSETSDDIYHDYHYHSSCISRSHAHLTRSSPPHPVPIPSPIPNILDLPPLRLHVRALALALPPALTRRPEHHDAIGVGIPDGPALEAAAAPLVADLEADELAGGAGILRKADPGIVAEQSGFTAYGVADTAAFATVETLRLLVGQNVPYSFVRLASGRGMF